MPTSPRLSNEQLTSIRQNTQWRDLFSALQIEKDPKKSKETDWWGKSPFRPQENTASFHINARGWYCHATSQGGGPIELVQRLNEGMSCYDAGRWLLKHGVSKVVEEARNGVADTTQQPREEAAEPLQNPAIRQDLRSQLAPGHSAFAERGIPDRVLCDLAAGYLDRAPRKNRKPDPMNYRLVFQIRSLRANDAGSLVPVIVGHMGRATSDEQAQEHGKWWTYAGFSKSLELYNVDRVVLGAKALEQARAAGHILVVEGCFDVAKLHAAGVENVVALLGSQASERQLELLELMTEKIGVSRLRLFLDRDDAGRAGTGAVREALQNAAPHLTVESFDWEQSWASAQRAEVRIPDSIADPCDFSVGQLQWLRSEGLI